MLYETLSNLAAIGVATNLAWKISQSIRLWFGIHWIEDRINNRLKGYESKVKKAGVLTESDYTPALEKVKKIKDNYSKLKKIEVMFTGAATSVLAILFRGCPR